MSEGEPGWQQRCFRCLKCRTSWTGWLPVRVPIDLEIAALKSVRCPQCRARPGRIVLDLERERQEGAA